MSARDGTKSISALCSRRAAISVSSLLSSFLWAFFHRMLAHSATIRSGAISLAFCRNASAKSVPSSSTTHLMAILASMTRGFNAPFALRAEELQTAFDVPLWSAYEDRLPADQRMVQPRPPETDEGSRDARLRWSAHAGQPGASDGQ